MDTLRGSFDALDNNRSYDAADDDAGQDAPPAAIGQDERRMQVRAYNHWASLLEDRNFPAIEDLEPDQLPDFGPYSVLLDFSAGIENPGISYLGDKLAAECDISDSNLEALSDVPSRSLLSRMTDHYLQILANQAPIGFEAEFVNQRGSTILYRGILLPFSSDDDTIDFIYGVINWKELADQQASDELLLEIDQALEQQPERAPSRKEAAPLTDWADGPGALAANDTDDNNNLVPESAEAVDYPMPGFDDNLASSATFDSESDAEVGRTPQIDAGKYAAALDDEDEDEDDEDGGLPSPTFGLSAYNPADYGEDEEDDEDEDEEDSASGSYAALTALKERDPASDREDPLDFEDPQDFGYEGQDHPIPQGYGAYDEPDADEPLQTAARLQPEPAPADDDGLVVEPAEFEAAELDPAEMELGDWLAAAREMAAAARSSEDRTRSALYEAIGRAYDFSLAADEAPGDYEELLSDSGLKVQERAPMTPVVKLVFGADYDKTRLTEYAAALSYARRFEVARGGLSEFLRQADGGLKGVVKAERRLRREEAGKAVEPDGAPREALARKLRKIEPKAFETIDPAGTEFALVMVRRTDTGKVVMLGEVPEDVALIERAGRKLVD